MDFTLHRYSTLLSECISSHKKILTMRSFMLSQPPENNMVVLRHDVDRRVKNALEMARLEAKWNIKATYYFRIPHTFDHKIIQEIAALGHEIGFHYETLAKTKGDIKKAYVLFERELEQLRKIAEVTTICMHGSPLSSYNNASMWDEFDYKTLGILGEPYLSLNYQQIIYLTDTGRSWGNQENNLRDHVNPLHLATPRIFSTEELVEFVKANTIPLIIQTHPERWAYSMKSFLTSWSFDLTANGVKRFLKMVRS